jgi:hypothetical protein
VRSTLRVCKGYTGSLSLEAQTKATVLKVKESGHEDTSN